MPQSRRAFLRDGLRSALSVGLLLGASRVGFGQTTQGQGRVTPSTQLEIPIEAQKDPVFLFVEETFKPYVDGIFQAPNARGEMIELKLIKLQGYKPSNKLTSRTRESKSFTLTFKASDELPPFTSIHTIRHPALGEFDLFLTKHKIDDDLFYEAVINHVK
ncbi:MAG TPA: hypothetical protein VFO99_08275 [Pyrinomonadaceae bacterium]|nr:hypothetical protein [Pyrinomonadaceae bacterium]